MKMKVSVSIARGKYFYVSIMQFESLKEAEELADKISKEFKIDRDGYEALHGKDGCYTISGKVPPITYSGFAKEHRCHPQEHRFTMIKEADLMYQLWMISAAIGDPVKTKKQYKKYMKLATEWSKN